MKILDYKYKVVFQLNTKGHFKYTDIYDSNVLYTKTFENAVTAILKRLRTVNTTIIAVNKDKKIENEMSNLLGCTLIKIMAESEYNYINEHCDFQYAKRIGIYDIKIEIKRLNFNIPDKCFID